MGTCKTSLPEKRGRSESVLDTCLSINKPLQEKNKESCSAHAIMLHAMPVSISDCRPLITTAQRGQAPLKSASSSPDQAICRPNLNHPRHVSVASNTNLPWCRCQGYVMLRY